MKTERQKAMERERSRVWRLNNPEKVAEQRAKYADRRAEYEATRLYTRYGLSRAHYQWFIVEQGNRCAGCGRKPGLSKTEKLYIDHDHQTGRVRGLLCHNCNAAVGYVKDSPDVLKKLAKYLEEPRIPD